MSRRKSYFYRVTPFDYTELTINGIPIPDVMIYAYNAFEALKYAKNLVDDPDTVFKATMIQEQDDE